MQYEVLGTRQGGSFMSRYKVTGKLLLEVLASKEPDESLTDAMARKLQQPRSEVQLHGADNKKVPKESVKLTVKQSCVDTRPGQWVPCERCWRRILKDVFDNRGRYCMVCGNNQNIQGHHIIPRAENGGHDWTNIAPLCSVCHDFVECHDKRPRTLEDVVRVGLERIA